MGTACPSALHDEGSYRPWATQPSALHAVYEKPQYDNNNNNEKHVTLRLHMVDVTKPRNHLWGVSQTLRPLFRTCLLRVMQPCMMDIIHFPGCLSNGNDE